MTTLPNRASASAASSVSSCRPSAPISAASTPRRARPERGPDRLPRDLQRPRPRSAAAADRGARSRGTSRSGAPLRCGRACHRARCCRHRLENRRAASRFCDGPGEARNAAPRADREVLEIAELLDLRERIDARFPRQIEQRFGPHADVGIAQQRRRLSAISRSPAPPGWRVRGGGSSASGWSRSTRSATMPAARALPLEEIQRVAHLRRIGGGELRRAARRPQSARATPLALRSVSIRCRWMLSWIVCTYSPPQPPGQHDPDRRADHVDDRGAAEARARARAASRTRRVASPRSTAPIASADPRDDDVDGVLDWTRSAGAIGR